MDTWWFNKVISLQQEGVPQILVSITNVRGSAPRGVGTRMIITQSDQWGTIGGGNLEFKITHEARKMLSELVISPISKEISLGASVGQCCGGSVTVLLEPIQSLSKLVVFGAGHVGRELIDLSQPLPVFIQWIDERANQFPKIDYHNVECIVEDDCVTALDELSGDEAIVILTHNHALDMRLCEGLLRRKHNAYIGLIGSRTKWKRFEHQLQERGFSKDAIDSILCPIGIPGINNKHPRAIAISIIAQLLQNFNLKINS